MVRADSGIDRIEDLKGKIVATNAHRRRGGHGLEAMLLQHGLEDKRDYQVVEIEFPNMLAAIEAKKIDLATLIMPFAIEAHKQRQSQDAVHRRPGDGRGADDAAGGARALHRRASRRAG